MYLSHATNLHKIHEAQDESQVVNTAQGKAEYCIIAS